jgi:phosphinothricin acetyltransferase
MIIRDAVNDDLPMILAIYNDVIRTSTSVYATEPVTVEDRRIWLETRRARGFPVLVSVDAGQVSGFASFGEWRASNGYRYTVEHSVHVRADLRGHGHGSRLVEALIERAKILQLHVMMGGIDAANRDSIRFHERLGFTKVGEIREVGRKFGRWLDLVFMQRMLEPAGTPRAD